MNNAALVPTKPVEEGILTYCVHHIGLTPNQSSSLSLNLKPLHNRRFDYHLTNRKQSTSSFLTVSRLWAEIPSMDVQEQLVTGNLYYYYHAIYADNSVVMGIAFWNDLIVWCSGTLQPHKRRWRRSAACFGPRWKKHLIYENARKRKPQKQRFNSPWMKD